MELVLSCNPWPPGLFQESAQEVTAALPTGPLLGHAGTARHLLGLSRAQPPAQHTRASPALGEGSRRNKGAVFACSSPHPLACPWHRRTRALREPEGKSNTYPLLTP